jgi:hypothetical protein
MERATALPGIEMFRFNVGPKSNQLTALGSTMHGFPADDSRGVEAAAAASTHAGHKEAEEEGSSNDCGQLHSRTSRKKNQSEARFSRSVEF